MHGRHLSQYQARIQHPIDARHDYYTTVTTSLLFNGCLLPIRKVRTGPPYLNPRLSPSFSLNILQSPLNTPEMLQIIQFLQSPVSSLTLKPRDMCSLALKHSVSSSCSSICHQPLLIHVSCPADFSANMGLPALSFPEYTLHYSHSSVLVSSV